MNAHELLRTYRRYIGESEASEVLHRWSFIAVLSANVGRRVYASFGHLKFMPNNYYVILGEPASRKSTAIKCARRLLELSGYNHFSANQTSREQFLSDLAQCGELDLLSVSETFICAPELNNFFGDSRAAMTTTLMELYDSDDVFETRFRGNKGQLSISYPTVNMLGGNTQANFATLFPPQIITNGFLSRILLVHGDVTGKKLPWGGTLDQQLELKIVTHLTHVRESLQGKLHYEPSAMRALEKVYETWPALEDNRFEYYNQRRYSHLIKLCVTLCASGGQMLLTEDVVILANTLLASIEENFSRALGEFGKSRWSEETSRIMEALHKSGRPMQSSELYALVQTNLERQDQFMDLIVSLRSSKKIDISPCGGFVATTPATRKIDYSDFSLLKTL